MSEQEAIKAVSTTVLEAQARLMSMREEHRRTRQHVCRNKLQASRPAQAYGKQIDSSDAAGSDVCQVVGKLPSHLGWGSQRLSESLRRSFAKSDQDTMQWLDELDWLQAPAPAPESTIPATAILARGKPSPVVDPGSHSSVDVDLATVKLHPSIGLGMLRSKAAAAGRLWLLLRWIDKSGSGQIKISRMRKLFCDQESAVRICGWRQLRSLTAQGEGIFWTQEDGRLWLKSIPRVAKALGVERLSGQPVALPVKTLTQGIGQVRAHLYASFHSGRKKALPISRTALTKISKVSPRAQQNYEKRTRVQKQKNIAIGPNLASESCQDQIWQHRSACFKWRDAKALLGAHGRSYLAWQLPNSYLGPHEPRPLGRQRKFNRELAVLFTKGMTGNDQSTVDIKPKRYFEAAKKAAWSQIHSQTSVYWLGKAPGMWHFMEATDRS